MFQKIFPYIVSILCIYLLFSLNYILIVDNTNPNEIIKADLGEFSKEQKLKVLEKSFKRYKDFTSIEHKIMWMKKYEKVSYKLGGDIALNKSDCSRASYYYWWDLGGQMNLSNVKSLKKELESYVVLNKVKIRKRIQDIELGDIIIFQPSRTNRWHMGIVNRITRTQVIFQDVNPAVNWTTDRSFVFNTRWLGYKTKIYEMSWDYWINNSLK